MSVNPSRRAHEEPSHLSIGEVLNILREEFPDVTISKIRFLESQGLVDPERTPSGYRKFYESDVSRLRWILHQQKENFLPLKVIKERLERMGEEQPAPVHAIARVKPRGRRAPSRRARHAQDLAPQLPLGDPMPVSPEHEELAPAAENGEEARRDDPPSRDRDAPPRDDHPPPRPDDAARPPRSEEPPADAPDDTAAPTGLKNGLTRGELARTAGLEDWQLNELESFGLLEPVAYNGRDALFDEEGQAIATAAAGFYAHGIGARHLRMYKHFADREAALFEQVILQYRMQRNPEARAKAQQELASLSRLGRALRSALLVNAVRDSLAE
ncbi:MAG TPA: MerR family transcriptional regulator [Acidimicrobiia bacterium]|nr:MerR family transcriptional regulator [Acidimicrobiia bacterium]